MNVYTTIVIIAIIIAICYLANLYASVSNWKEDNVNAIKKMNTTNDYLYRILNMLDDFKDKNKN